MHIHTHTHTHRVEGQGAAVITDVIYSSETEPKAGKGGASSGSKVEYEGLQAEIQEREGELKRLRFKDEVLGRQRTLLVQFASHISKGRSETSQIESISLKTERDASHFKKKGGEYGLRKESRHSSFPPPSPPAPDIDVAKVTLTIISLIMRCSWFTMHWLVLPGKVALPKGLSHTHTHTHTHIPMSE